jgi:hypothetical protein
VNATRERPVLSETAGTAVAPSETLAHQGLYQHTYETVVGLGSIVEIRAFKIRGRRGIIGKLSGFYDNAEDFVRDAHRLDGKAEGVYIVANPITRERFAASPNRLREPGTGDCASAAHIVRRRWLLVDIDPIRPAGTSSSDSELSFAVKLADTVWLALRTEGWGDPVAAISGNGAHLLYPIDLPTNDEGRVARALRGLSQRFSNHRAKIDCATSDAARLTKLYGTVARKGTATDERPHRRSMLLGRWS